MDATEAEVLRVLLEQRMGHTQWQAGVEAAIDAAFSRRISDGLPLVPSELVDAVLPYAVGTLPASVKKEVEAVAERR